METSRSRWQRKKTGHSLPSIHVPACILQRWWPDGPALCYCQVATGKCFEYHPSLLRSSSSVFSLPSLFLSTLTFPHPTDLHLKPHILIITDCTQTHPGCLACNAIKFSKVDGSAQHRARSKYTRHSHQLAIAFKGGTSGSKLNWAEWPHRKVSNRRWVAFSY